MAGRIVLNTPRYKGEFPFDIEEDPLTNLEWRWIKKISGYLPLTIEEGWKGGDPDLFVAFAVIALVRSGRVRKEDALTAADALADAPFDGTAITMVADEVADADPPPVTAETPTRTGLTSLPSSGSWEDDPRSTGLPDSERSAASAPAT